MPLRLGIEANQRWSRHLICPRVHCLPSWRTKLNSTKYSIFPRSTRERDLCVHWLMKIKTIMLTQYMYTNSVSLIINLLWLNRYWYSSLWLLQIPFIENTFWWSLEFVITRLHCTQITAAHACFCLSMCNGRSAEINSTLMLLLAFLSCEAGYIDATDWP